MEPIVKLDEAASKGGSVYTWGAQRCGQLGHIVTGKTQKTKKDMSVMLPTAVKKLKNVT